MEKIKQEDKDIILKVEVKDGRVNTTLVNFFLSGMWDGTDLKMDEQFLRAIDHNMENATEDKLKKYYWESSALVTAEQFRRQAEAQKDKELAEGFMAVANAIEEVDWEQVTLQMIHQ